MSYTLEINFNNKVVKVWNFLVEQILKTLDVLKNWNLESILITFSMLIKVRGPQEAL